MAAVDSGVETESESFNEDSSNSLPSTPKVEDEGLHGVSFYHCLVASSNEESVDKPVSLFRLNRRFMCRSQWSSNSV